MFWTRASASTPSAADANSVATSSTIPSTVSRSMGFFTAVDGSRTNGNSTVANQSAGENAREDVVDETSESVDDSAMALPPSYVLSEQRRSELLRAARATRTSWIDGGRETEGNNPNQWAVTDDGTSALPPHCQAAIEQISLEMQSLVTHIDQLKRKILPDDLFVQSPERKSMSGEKDRDNNETQVLESVTIADELRVHQTELANWRRVHVVNGRVVSLRTLTASDKESLFLLAFQDLLVLLKHPLAAELVYQLQLFVRQFNHWNLELMLQHRALPDRPGGHLQSFIDKLVRQLQHTGQALFDATAVEILSLKDNDDQQLLHEVLEAFLLEKLYAKALTPSTKAEREDDELRDRLTSLSFVDFRHLDLPPPASEAIEQQWTILTNDLAMLSLFPSARRKMDCVMRVCQGLTSLLTSLHPTGKFPSADEFLPALIYLLLKANPRQLERNVQFILEYRRPNRLVSEPGYFFTHLVSSVAFLEHVNGELLTITPEEFDAGLQNSKRQIEKDVVESARERAEVVRADANRTDEARLTVSLPPLPTVLEVRARRVAATSSK